MKVSQILNNNVAVVKKGSNEIVVYAKGISFKKKPGDRIEANEIDKMYVLDSNDKLEHFSYLLSHTKSEYFQIVNEIISYGEKYLNIKISDYLYLTLLDHLDFTIKRMKKNQVIVSPLKWEVKKYYPNYYHVGKYALSIIKNIINIECPEDEAVSIALHFINSQIDDGQTSQMVAIMEAMKDILSIIQFHYHITFEEDSLNFMRLVTHLQYFVTRLMKHDVYESDEIGLNDQIKKLYPEAYRCILKIAVYVKNTFQKELTKDEETYLMIHIHRVTQREERKS